MDAENLFSRQIGTYGAEMMQKISGMSVFLSGLRGLGVEVAKNLILSGIRKLTIHDNSIVEARDMSSNYCIEDSDVEQKTRAEACMNKLRRLSPSIVLEVYRGELEDLDLTECQIVVLTESSLRQINLVSTRCRERNVAFISAENWGPLCYIFVDFGPDFIIHDSLGINYEDVYISSITQSDPAVVTTLQPHKLSLGCFLVFEEINGMVELNRCEPIPVVNIVDEKSFEIPSTLGFTPYVKNGIAKVVKLPIKKQYSTFQDCFLNPRHNNQPHIRDFTKPERKWHLHLAVMSILKFTERFMALPKLLDSIDSRLCLTTAKRTNSFTHLVAKVDEDLVKKASNYARLQVSAIASVWGGVVAQEVLKITGKYTSIYQWGHLDFFDIVMNSSVPRSIDRYFDIVTLIGEDAFQVLREKNIFIVGSGALGCELIKHLAMLGAGTRNAVVVTDDDSIELSNLSRQFLFRTENIGQSKSKIAVEAALRINPQATMQALTEKVCSTNEKSFPDDFWQTLDVVLLAVDNLEARNYVDSMCVWHKKTLLESGTLGMQASSQCIIPMQTLTYRDIPQSTTKEIAMCTLKSFPYLIVHCIEWARDIFEEFFRASIEELNKFNSDPAGYCDELFIISNLNLKYEKVCQLLRILFLRHFQAKAKLIEGACAFYLSIFRDNILDLLWHNPPDSKKDDGTPFWSGTKRLPVKAEINETAECIEILFACCNILLKSARSSVVIEKSDIASFVSQYDPYVFQPKLYGSDDKIAHFIEEQMNYLGNFEKFETSFEPVSFEKDDDTNHHVDFIWYASNVRATSYGLETTDKMQAKLISGRIIPAIASTTSIISGFVAVEFIKTALFNAASHFKNVNMNLAIPTIKIMNPSKPIKVRDQDDNESKYTVWDYFEIQGSLTLQNFLDRVRGAFGIDIVSVSVGEIALFHSTMTKEYQIFMQRKIEDEYQEICGKPLNVWKKSLEIIIEGCKEGTKEGALLPKLKYYIA